MVEGKGLMGALQDVQAELRELDTSAWDEYARLLPGLPYRFSHFSEEQAREYIAGAEVLIRDSKERLARSAAKPMEE